MTPDGAWQLLSAPEQAVLEMAWSSCVAGTTGVGTAVLDESGTLLALARNTTREAVSEMPLTGSYVAHAEINAIAQVPTNRKLDQCTVLSSLLPCLMCAGAMVMSHVGRVCYLAPDPVFVELDRMSDASELARRQWPIYQARPHDRWTVVAMVLGAHAKAIEKPDGMVMAAHERREPEVAQLIRSVVKRGTISRATRGMPLLELLGQIWDEVEAVATVRAERLLLERDRVH